MAKKKTDEWKVICDRRCIIGEGPVWNDKEGVMYFTNGLGEEICKLDICTGEVSVRQVDGGVAAIAFDKDNRMIVSRYDGVYYLENDKNNQVYIEENLEKMDSYDIYLDGASSYIEIINDRVLSDRELVIFRDSFSSSLAPLLIEYYSKITLIDIRYINSEMYLDKINFDNQDVLFLYSTLLVNNSYTLKD